MECVNSEIARSAAEEARKKALEDLEAERARSCSLSDDVDRLKRALLEKDGAISQAGKAIEDLRVANTELVRSNREVERANTNLVGENTALEESIRGMSLLSSFFSEVCLVLSNFFMLVLAGLKDELLATLVKARSIMTQLEGEVSLNGHLRIQRQATSRPPRSLCLLTNPGRRLEATHSSTSYATLELR